ncbi:choline dehydrogenase [Methanobrevibacter cuticularis]|uniref:Choline dehydrogenase n=1 Tax=Methanobrevibacter cuticularis TaxID=47311 RepID=A0A166CY47_9EURY|nr:GMC family oxidoreductase N-terminal domain-containing protein [Methanobrevibacter cuticularis]KZX14985.1 choline dehydrogenase [Methanobrevibacter cuticularis]
MVIIVGSGAGGAIIAMKLALANIPVTLIEKGPLIDSKDAFDYYDESDEGVDLLKTTCVGGSTIVAAGNGVRLLEDEFESLGIPISKELDEVEELLSIHELDDDHFGKGSQKFMDAAEKLNLNPIKMPKFIRNEDCVPCGSCAYGCPLNAKWSSADFVKIAVENGAELLDSTEVVDLSVEDNKIKGVYVKSENSDETKFIGSDLVVLSAGAINSAILLQKIGLPAGEKLFLDPFVTVGGVLKNIGFNKDVLMTGLVVGENYVLAPHFSQFVAKKLRKYGAEDGDILSIMVKIPDDTFGQVKDGKVIKQNSIKDVSLIAEGSAAAGAILVESGVDPKTIVSTNLRGAHPGGTAAIGEIVDNNLKTEIEGLYVGDASVIPKAPGAPPLLVILALSLRLSKHLLSELEN